METVLRSRDLYGPYESCPFNPILSKKNPLSPIQRTGHGKPVMLPDGRWYMPYLCNRPVEGMTLMGRETALDPLTWTADGWPMVNALKGPSCLQVRPFPGISGSPDLTEAWISPRNDPKRFVLSESPVICLRCGPDPASTDPCSVLLRRQTESVLIQSVLIDMSRAQEGDFGALTGYYDEQSFYLFGLRKEKTGCSLILTEQAGAGRNMRILASLDEQSAIVSVRGNGLDRCLYMEDSSVASIRTEYLCDEGLPSRRRFTGAMFGFTAVGTGTVSFQDCNRSISV